MTHTDQSTVGLPPTGIIKGLLFSQIGYDVGQPIRVIIRCTEPDFVGDLATCQILQHSDGHVVLDQPLTYWGKLWGSHWWIADLTNKLPVGEYDVQLVNDATVLLSDHGLCVGENLLFDRTWQHVSYEQLERRAIIAKVKPGWYDAGVLWEESNAHSAMLIGLFDLLEHAGHLMNVQQRQRVTTQIRGGCDYLLLTYERAIALGHPAGAMVHDMLDHQHMVMVADVSKAALALARAVNVLDSDTDKYAHAARQSLLWVLDQSTPAGGNGFGARAHGVSGDYVPPVEHRMSDLMMCCWAAFELSLAGQSDMQKRCVELSQILLSRQVPKDKAEDGLYGHFYTYQSDTLTEKAWTHSGACHPQGADNGQTFPQYVMPLVFMLERWPEHELAVTWRHALEQYAYGFFQPACRLSPFLILPLGYYPGEGWLHFVGLWHGMNAVYGLAASLALTFERLFEDASFREIAVGNLQWIAGLNAGLTAQCVRAAVLWSTDLPEGVAIPHSMIQGIGNRTAGCWKTIRGSIANGFGCGQQFQLDVQPTRANDGPFALHDEDWITHGGGWLSGISRLAQSQSLSK